MASNSLKMRDAVVTMITGLIDRQRPKPRVCEVYSYNRFTRFADVLLPGETAPGIQARFPAHLQPTASKMDDGVGNATGNLVLVEGTTNNYRITQVIEGDTFGQTAIIRPNDTLSGGGTITWDDRYLKWSADFISVVGVDQLLTGGMFVIPMPAVSTLVKCHGINGNADSAVVAGGIDMQPDGTSNYSILYYEPDLGGGSGSNGIFHLVGTVTPFIIPPTWITIALMDQVSNYLSFATGHSIKPWQKIVSGEFVDLFIRGIQSSTLSLTTTAVFQTITNWTEQVSDPTWMAYSAGVWTVNAPGTYEIKFMMTTGSTATGGRAVRINKNNGTIIAQMQSKAVDTSLATGVFIAKDAALVAGDTIRLDGMQSSGGALSTVAGENFTYYSMKRIGP